MKTIILNSKQESELNQILNELIYSLKKTFSEDDLLNLAYNIFKESAFETFKSKKKTFKSTLKKIKRISGETFLFIKTKIKNYSKNGIEKQFHEDFEKIKTLAGQTPEKIIYYQKKIRDKFTEFRVNFIEKSKEEKIEFIAVTIMGSLIFFASAGGADLEGGIPDSDLNAGIGHHRNLFSHTILIGFLVEFIMRSGVGMIDASYKNLPEEHHTFWDKSRYYIHKHKGVAIGSMWAGVGAHLLKDANLLSARTKPYTGVPFKMSMAAHQNLFAANATAASFFAYDEIKNNELIKN